MKPNKLRILISFLIASPNLLQAQIVHAENWTGYIDANGINSMVQQDSFLYVTTAYGTAFINTNSPQVTYFCDMGNPALPNFLDLKIATVDQEGNLWTLFEGSLIKISPSGILLHVGGLPDYQVLVLKADHTGNIWAGMVTEPFNNPATSECLAKFTGNSWKPVDLGQTRMNIFDIDFDVQNNPVVIASSVYNSGGVFQFNGAGFVRMPGSSGLFKLAVSSDGQIACCGDGCCGTKLSYFKDGVWTNYGQLNSNLTPDFSLPRFDANNTLWVAHGGGLVYKMENDVLELQLTAPSSYLGGPMDELSISGFYLDAQGHLWLGKMMGLFSASGQGQQLWDFIPTGTLQFPGSPQSIATYKDTVWLANSKGVTRFAYDTWEQLDYTLVANPKLFYDTIRMGLWIGSSGALDFYQGADHVHIDLAPYLRNPFYNWIGKITGDADGNIWINTPKTLLRYDLNGNWYGFDCGEEFSEYFQIGHIYPKGTALYCAVGGAYPWLPSVSHRNLYKIEGNSLTDLNVSEDLLNQVGAFALVSEQNIWFDGASKVIHYENGQTTIYTSSDLGGNLNVQEFIVYNDSTILLCSNFGLYVYKQGRWYYPSIPSDKISNSGAIPFAYSNTNKLYMRNFPLLVLEDVAALLKNLVQTGPDTLEVMLEPKVYPNPTSAYVILENFISAYGTDVSAVLYNAYGQVIRTVSAPLPSRIDLSKEPKGVYFLSIDNMKSKVKSFKIVRQ